MLKKKKKKVVIGVSKELPEGIFGNLSEKKRKARTRELKKRIRPLRRDEQVNRELFGYKPHLSILDPMPIPAKKKRPPVEAPRTAPVAKALTKKKKKAQASSIMPKLRINYDHTLPEGAENLRLENVVSMGEDLLKNIIRATEGRTDQLSELMLQSITPSVLAFDAASSYTQAVLAKGLKIETEVDRSLAEVVQSLSRLDVINFFVQKLNISPELRARVLEKYADGLTEQALLKMVKDDKAASMSNTIRELDAVLVKRSERQAQDREVAQRNKARRGPTPVTDDGAEVVDSRRRTRSDAPRSGGF